jgi:hypothetical protein
LCWHFDPQLHDAETKNLGFLKIPRPIEIQIREETDASWRLLGLGERQVQRDHKNKSEATPGQDRGAAEQDHIVIKRKWFAEARFENAEKGAAGSVKLPEERATWPQNCK